MKTWQRKVLENSLRVVSIAILKKYKPTVVGVTGSVGKTSTVQAIFTVLSAGFRARKSYKNYNNEIGAPLTILGVESGNKSIFAWVKVFFKALILIIFKDKKYPEILVLEMGADRPGDLKYLTSFIPIKIGVVTGVGESHVEFFDTIDNIAQEKSSLISALPADGLAVLNFDDHRAKKMFSMAKCKVASFGFLPGAEFEANDINLIGQDIKKIGINFNLFFHDKNYNISLPKIIAEHLVYSALVAIAVGLYFKLELPGIIETLKDFEAPSGRMKLIYGIKNSLIIDDTYNSSPLSTRKALYQLSKITVDLNSAKYAVLGDMLELGVLTVDAHQEIGQAVVQYGMDYLITVGEMSRDIVRGAKEAGMDQDHCFNFSDLNEAGEFLKQKIHNGDLILVKGSQGVRMEKIVKEIMADPQKAPELLVRQDNSWQ